MSNSNKPTLLLITAANCPACVSFKNGVWPQLKPKIQQLDRVHLEEVNLPSTASALPSTFPSDLKRFVGWFPTLVLVSPQSWQQGGKLDAVVFNGEFNGNIMTHGRERAPYPTTTQGVLDWLNSELRKLSTVSAPHGRSYHDLSSESLSSTSMMDSSTSMGSSRSSSQSSSTQSSRSQPVFRGVRYLPRNAK